MFELIAHISVVPDTGNDCYPIRPKPTAEKDLERILFFMFFSSSFWKRLSTFVLLQKISFSRCKEILLGDIIKLFQKIKKILIFFSAIRRSRLS